ncbi:protease [Devosia sp. Root413D1]|uniref:ubiquinone anaerobic biosynthesis protein UbiV n=1 Tax=Devosia sp. Root413D1 TaxID=1736531 RepID=UPI0006FE4ABC|nr:U32 family peptidase [Devosia sp. Root413D1]KQW76081.1 protease [Devosia sp. Root413D1]
MTALGRAAPTLTLGPVLFLWEPATWRDFYYRIADEADVDTVVVGEVVCSKRSHFHDALTGKVVDRLAASGKQVRLASLALVTLERELQVSHRLARQSLEVEVSELSAHAAMAGKPHAVSPLVNVYNAATARVLATRGATSICLPPELPASSIRAIVEGAPDIRFEVFSFGRVPLAISARCAHARVKGNTKDNCKFICGEDPDGLAVDTLDGQHFLALNGVQTMSSTVQCLITDVPELMSAGVSSLRLSPQVCDMARVAETFREVVGGRMDPNESLLRLRDIHPGAEFSNGFLHGLPGHLLKMPELPLGA